MPLEPEHGTPFARDMRRIREARHLSLEDLHEETKIPSGLLESFEERALFDHAQFNRVYLRSFVRTYAQVVGIDTEAALEGLEEALAGRYVGSLAVSYLDEQPDVQDESPQGALSSGDDSGEIGEGSERVGGELAEVHTSGEDAGENDTARPSPVAPPAAAAAGTNARVGRLAPEDDAAAWTAQSPPSPSAPAGTTPGPNRNGADRKWILGGGLVIMAAFVWLLVRMTDGSEELAPQPPLAADTTKASVSADTTPRAEAVPLNIPALGDTMNVRIVAAHGRVDPIRVTVDDDLRRPYWIERGDSMTFQATARIIIEELLDSVEVRLEGVEYPTSRRDEQGRIVITHDGALQYFDALRQDA